jgi:hypothetical protein
MDPHIPNYNAITCMHVVLHSNMSFRDIVFMFMQYSLNISEL